MLRVEMIVLQNLKYTISTRNRELKIIVIYFQDIIWNQGDGTSSSRRKIIVYLTDEGVNSAGDGAKGGILTPAGEKD